MKNKELLIMLQIIWAIPRGRKQKWERGEWLRNLFGDNFSSFLHRVWTRLSVFVGSDVKTKFLNSILLSAGRKPIRECSKMWIFEHFHKVDSRFAVSGKRFLNTFFKRQSNEKNNMATCFSSQIIWRFQMLRWISKILQVMGRKWSEIEW